jgi:hypothetical protein
MARAGPKLSGYATSTTTTTTVAQNATPGFLRDVVMAQLDRLSELVTELEPEAFVTTATATGPNAMAHPGIPISTSPSRSQLPSAHSRE